MWSLENPRPTSPDARVLRKMGWLRDHRQGWIPFGMIAVSWVYDQMAHQTNNRLLSLTLHPWRTVDQPVVVLIGVAERRRIAHRALREMTWGD